MAVPEEDEASAAHDRIPGFRGGETGRRRRIRGRTHARGRRRPGALRPPRTERGHALAFRTATRRRGARPARSTSGHHGAPDVPMAGATWPRARMVASLVHPVRASSASALAAAFKPTPVRPTRREAGRDRARARRAMPSAARRAGRARMRIAEAGLRAVRRAHRPAQTFDHRVHRRLPGFVADVQGDSPAPAVRSCPRGRASADDTAEQAGDRSAQSPPELGSAHGRGYAVVRDVRSALSRRRARAQAQGRGPCAHHRDSGAAIPPAGATSRASVATPACSSQRARVSARRPSRPATMTR